MSDAEQPNKKIYDLFEKSQTVDPEVRAHVYSLVTALGGTGASENGEYVLGDDGLACLRDLKRWLKIYDEKNNRLDVARCLAEADLMNGDLLPILVKWRKDAVGHKISSRVSLACLELLVPLTWPLEQGGEMTVNHHRHTPYIQQAQVRYKAGILEHGKAMLLDIIIRVALPSIAIHREDRSARDEGIMKLLLYFLRNICVITTSPSQPNENLDNLVSKSATIEAFYRQNVTALLLTLCSNMGSDFNHEDVILLDIIFNLIKGVSAEQLFMNEKQREVWKMRGLQDAMQKEHGMHRDYAKVAPSRHGRFGTMIWIQRGEDKMASVSGQDNLKDDRNSLLKMDKSKKWSKPQQRRKDLAHSIHEFDRTVRLTSSANALLRDFVEVFLDSGFNPLFTHLRKAIDREADRIQDVNCRQFFYTVSWFLQAERYRRTQQKMRHWKQRGVETPPDKDGQEESYGLVAAVLNQETFIVLNRYMQTSLENKEWQDLNAGMKCFTQILLMVQEMAQSSQEDDQEIADNIQSRIFYEESTHDRIVNILKGYKDQGFGYLDACTELSHVFLRMLERYSKQNADLQIRSRRRAQRKKKRKINEGRVERPDAINPAGQKATLPELGEGNDGDNDNQEDTESEDEDLVDAAQLSRERSFDFSRFSAKFTSQTSVDTFVALTAFYRDLSEEQLKRAHRFFHRVAFKQELAALLFRVDIVALFYKMIKGPESLDQSLPIFKEWEEFVRQVLKRMLRKLDERPELLLEMLFSKTRTTMYYLEHGHGRRTAFTNRALPELEVTPAPGRDVFEQIGIVVAALLEDGQGILARWVLDNVKQAIRERNSWEAQNLAAQERFAQDADKPIGQSTRQRDGREESIAPVVVPRWDQAEVKIAAEKNAKFRLVLRLCGFEKMNLAPQETPLWSMSPHLSSTQLEEVQNTLQKYLDVVWKDPQDSLRPGDLLRHTIAKMPEIDDFKGDGHRHLNDGESVEPRPDAFIDDSEGSNDENNTNLDSLFPANLRTRGDNDAGRHSKGRLIRKVRPQTVDQEKDDKQEEERRRAREQAALNRRRKIKSELYIHDSDEEMDEDEDRAFFAREEENRKRQAKRVSDALRALAADRRNNESGNGKGLVRSGKSKKRKSGDESSDCDSSRKTRKSTASNRRKFNASDMDDDVGNNVWRKGREDWSDVDERPIEVRSSIDADDTTSSHPLSSSSPTIPITSDHRTRERQRAMEDTPPTSQTPHDQDRVNGRRSSSPSLISQCRTKYLDEPDHTQALPTISALRELGQPRTGPQASPEASSAHSKMEQSQLIPKDKRRTVILDAQVEEKGEQENDERWPVRETKATSSIGAGVPLNHRLDTHTRQRRIRAGFVLDDSDDE